MLQFEDQQVPSGRDLEGNRLEVFIDTKWHVPQPCRTDIDLLKSDEEILAFVDRQVASLEGVVVRSDWERDRQPAF